MLFTALIIPSVLSGLTYYIVVPVIIYFRDSKGFRRYPNLSPLAGITDLPYCRLSAGGSRSRELTEAHKKHPVLRIGPNSLSFGNVEAIRGIYGHGTHCIKDLKYSITAGDHPHLFDVIDKTKHAEKRKRLSAAFAIKNLEEWEYKVARTTGRLLDALDARCTGPMLTATSAYPESSELTVDWNYWVYLFTIEAINYLALSTELGLLEQGHDLVTAQKLDGTLYRANYRKAQASNAYATSHFVWDYKNFRSLVWLSKFFPGWRKVWSDAAAWQDITYHQAQTRLERYQKGEHLDDFFSALMHDKTGSPYSLEWGEIAGEVAAIIDAGADTTAIALTQVLDFLIRHPAHLQTLREEIESVLDAEDVVASYDSVKNLPFLRACLDEAMRLSPPTSAGLPRRTPPEGAEIMGKWIPGDTSVSMTIYTAHHDPAIFPNPDEYRPQRWMKPDERRRMESYFIPFSTGGRGCIGRNISYLEQTVVLASLVHRYDFALPGPDWSLPRFEAFNLQIGSMPLKIWRRTGPAV